MRDAAQRASRPPVPLAVLLVSGSLYAAAATALDAGAAAELVVKYRPGPVRAQVEAESRLANAVVLDAIEALDAYLLGAPEGTSAEALLERYRQDPRVEYAEPNPAIRGGLHLCDDRSFELQWSLHNTGQWIDGRAGFTDADVDAVEGWEITRGSSSTVVAVLDTGIDSDHPEFQGRILPGYDFVNRDADPEDDEGHGTLVTGIIAANADNGFSVAGIDHAARILPVKVLNANNVGSFFALARGIVYAANAGADVINMSIVSDWGSTRLLEDALRYARERGSILVACAGNGGLGDANRSAPGSSPWTISVGATTNRDERAVFSATGAALDVVAPGESVVTLRFGTDEDLVTLFSGCSAATPVVSGIAALLRSVDPLLTHAEILDILAATAQDRVGSPREDTPGRDDFFGYGRVNMNRALREIALVDVRLDIKPGDAENAIQASDKGLVPVAILGSSDFDVAEVDVATLTFFEMRHHYAVAAPAHDLRDPKRLRKHTRDVDRDGFPDLVSHYRTEELGIHVGDDAACLAGETFDGILFEGCDEIVALAPKGHARCGQGFALPVVLAPLLWLRLRRTGHRP
ncbi:MAG: S8 family serine peptidase [Deltaproteobacteria bacterium]|nr:MAG: S8 family serine peptidase [Deltaproteobacteria bacterium]